MCWGDALHALERLETALRLTCLGGLGAEPLDERFHVANLALLAHIERGLLGELSGALRLEGRIVAAIGVHLPVLYVDDAVADAIEKFAIMRNQQQGARIGAQPGFQPENGINIQMVGRLVQQQQIRAAHERACHIDAHPPAAGKAADRPLIFRGRKAQAMHELRGAGPRVVAANFCVTCVQHAQTCAVIQFGGSRDSGFYGTQLAVTIEHKFDGGLFGSLDVLRDVRRDQIAGHVKVAGVGVHGAAHQLQQRGFAAAIFTRDADLLAAKQVESGSRKQHARATANGDVGKI